MMPPHPNVKVDLKVRTQQHRAWLENAITWFNKKNKPLPPHLHLNDCLKKKLTKSEMVALNCPEFCEVYVILTFFLHIFTHCIY